MGGPNISQKRVVWMVTKETMMILESWLDSTQMATVWIEMNMDKEMADVMDGCGYVDLMAVEGEDLVGQS